MINRERREPREKVLTRIARIIANSIQAFTRCLPFVKIGEIRV